MDTTFIDDLASAAPTPGGGGAAAFAGALSAALASMVGNLTVGKKTYADVEDEVRGSLERLERLRAHLVALVDEDARAFEPLSAAYRMPTSTDQERAAKHDAMQAALAEACEVPLEIMRTTSAVVDEVDFLAHKGSRLARSDAGAAAAFARASVEGASLNILINAASMEDEELASRYRGEALALVEAARERCGRLFDYVMLEIS